MKHRLRALVVLLTASAWAFAAVPVEAAQGDRRRPENWPNSPYPAGERRPDGSVGCRMEMGELLERYRRDELILKTDIEDAGGRWGTYAVADEMSFQAAIGPGRNRHFGSVKHGTDGGYLEIRVRWMDGEGERVLREDVRKNTAGC